MIDQLDLLAVTFRLPDCHYFVDFRRNVLLRHLIYTEVPVCGCSCCGVGTVWVKGCVGCGWDSTTLVRYPNIVSCIEQGLRERKRRVLSLIKYALYPSQAVSSYSVL